MSFSLVAYLCSSIKFKTRSVVSVGASSFQKEGFARSNSIFNSTWQRFIVSSLAPPTLFVTFSSFFNGNFTPLENVTWWRWLGGWTVAMKTRTVTTRNVNLISHEKLFNYLHKISISTDTRTGCSLMRPFQVNKSWIGGSILPANFSITQSAIHFISPLPSIPDDWDGG